MIRPGLGVGRALVEGEVAGRHWVIARGLPKTPVGALKMTFWAASGSPGPSSSNEVTRSGWPPAWEVELTS